MNSMARHKRQHNGVSILATELDDNRVLSNGAELAAAIDMAQASVLRCRGA